MPSVKVPPTMLLVTIRPSVDIVIGPLKVNPLLSPVALFTVMPYTMVKGFATTRSPPIGTSTLLELLIAVTVPTPNGPETSPALKSDPICTVAVPFN